MKISVIIPCFNDYQYILKIVGVIKKSNKFSEIIIVDDGSSPKTKKVLNNIKNVKLLTHYANLGKSQALKTGFLSSESPIVLFLDSDIIGLKTEHLNQITKPVVDLNYDVCIGQFIDKFGFFKTIGQTTMLSGLRCYRRKVLQENMDIFNSVGAISGYLIEVKTNQHIFSPSYSVARTTMEGATQKYKWQKGDFIKGAAKDLKMMAKILRYLGPKKYIQQLLFSQKIPHFS